MCGLTHQKLRVLVLVLSCFGAGVVCIVLGDVAAAKEKSPQTVTKLKEDLNETVWLVNYPEVTKSFTEYPDIAFRENDEVYVTGGGCVQTGGRGRTWKRYIDPLGPNSDRLYHGRIWIPGATGGLVRISSLVGSTSIEAKPVRVSYLPKHPEFQASPYFLRLGYEDDHYGDNGYYRHDDGTDNQCTLTPLDQADAPNNGNAWLQIRILHGGSAVNSRAAATDRAPFDLVWDEVDDNLLPLNPDWWVHANHHIFPNSNRNDDKQGCDQFREGRGDLLVSGKNPKCTTWDPDVDEANTLSLFCHLARPFANSVHGHVNWAVVTYKGRIYFDVANNYHIDKLAGTIGDGDYDWLFVPQNSNGEFIENGVAEGNLEDSIRAVQEQNLPEGVKAFALEFSSRETIDRMDDSPVWKTFHRAVDQKDQKPARKMVGGKYAIVVGLLGFDNEHGDRSAGARVELHPVYGLAIRVSEDNDPEDRWMIMARNWGNEGSCSNGFDVTGGKWKHYLNLHNNQMKFFLPGSFSGDSIVGDFHATYGKASGKWEKRRYQDGLLLTINLPEPTKKSLFWGELRMKKLGRT